MKNQEFEQQAPEEAGEDEQALFSGLPDGPKLLNFARFGQVLEAADILRRAADDPEAVIHLRLDPDLETGSLTVVLDLLAVDDAVEFAGMMGLADCTEFFPRTDGRLEVSLTFFRLFLPI